jgi:hypothetical protein
MLKHCVANRKRRLSALPNVGPYIYIHDVIQGAQKDLHPRTRMAETKGKTQKRMERGSRKTSSSAGSEKMERDSDR